ncbi:hypothetical protein BC830DRAFT_685092 [Chytriomyces sp. MP71]|nr:hypothetical protein BC830DRAFT_685092 [Chytriomyces sp. MP71]
MPVITDLVWSAPASLVVQWGLLPFLHHKLLQAPLSTTTVTCTLIGLYAIFYVFYCDKMVLAMSNMQTMFSILAIASQPRQVVAHHWNFRDHFQFVTTSVNRHTLGDIMKGKTEVVMPKDRTIAYLGQQLVNIAIGVVTYCFVQAYFEVFPLDFDVPSYVLSPLDWRGAVDYSVVALGQISLISISMPLFSFWAPLQTAPLIPFFSYSRIPASLSEFWSRSWNPIFASLLHRSTFLPVLKRMSSQLPDARWRSFNITIAVMTTFAVSGLVHELHLGCFVGWDWAGYQMAFFLLHGTISIVETNMRKWSGFGRTWGTGRVARTVVQIVTAYVFILTLPVFACNFLRESISRTLACHPHWLVCLETC